MLIFLHRFNRLLGFEQLSSKSGALPRGALLLMLALSGCATVDAPSKPPMQSASAVVAGKPLDVINRITWGVNASTMQQVDQIGVSRYLDAQLTQKRALPAAISQQITDMTIVKQDMPSLVAELEQRRKDADIIKDDDAKKVAQQAYQNEMNRVAREASTRALMRAVYSPNQLQEQMVWFWMNHFSIHQGKHNIRAMIGDFEESAIRPHVLGKFRELLTATVFHPAMIRYLDNEQNAVNRINENYARELMELHTLGVGGGYSQKDVQELARVLTGVGVNLGTTKPNVRKEIAAQYVRSGIFEFNPNRHDYGDKLLLGRTLKGRGLAEVNEAIGLLARHPSTARYVCSKLAIYFVADQPPAALVDRMTVTFLQTDGDISATLRTLFASNEFNASLGHKFKTPMQYVVSAVRLAYDDKPILNAGPMQNWLNRMGQPLFGRQTPDGYSMIESAWASPGQMNTRFEIAKAIGSGSAGLFKTEGPQPVEKPAFPQLANALYYNQIERSLNQATRKALEQSATPQEWNMVLLSAPEMMYR